MKTPLPNRFPFALPCLLRVPRRRGGLQDGRLRHLVHAPDVFGHFPTVQIPASHQLLHPEREAIGEFQLEHDLRKFRVKTVGSQRAIVVRQSELPIKRDAQQFVVRRHPRLAQVMDDDPRRGVNRVAQLAEAAQDEIVTCISTAHQIILRRPAAGREQTLHACLTRCDALLDDHVADAPLDLEEDRRLGVLVVVTNPKFVAVFVAVGRRAIQHHARGIEVDAVDRVRVGPVRQGVAVALNVGADEVAYAARVPFVDEVFQLVAAGVEMTT
jgi:hypothetical protein